MFLSVIGRRCAWALFSIALVSPTARAVDAPQTQKHFLWRITNAPAPFYLLGSMHALRDSDYPLAPQIEQVVANSRKVIFETNPHAKDAVLLAGKVGDAGRYRSGVRIENKVRPETFALLRRITNMRTSEYADYKPWAIAYFMVSPPGTEKFRPRLSLDWYIYRHARASKEIDGVETTDEFVRALSEMSDAESEAFLLESIDYARRSPGLLVETTEAWKSGDTRRVYELYAPRRRTISGYWHWINRRHPVWIPRIEQAIKAGKPTLVVAGALHFCGPNNVVELLRARGYQIEQL
jgi:uncharacterized protein YbaP (TraB family)